MKKIVLYALIIVGILFLARFIVKHRNSIVNLVRIKEANTLKPNLSAPILAVFSFQPGATNEIIKSFPHYIIKLNDVDHWKINRKEIAQIPDNVPIMFTIETWGGKLISSYLYNPIEDLLTGKFDQVIKQLCTQFIGTRPNIYFRLNPEMEVPSNHYPWQRHGGDVKAFTYFSALCKTFAPQIKQVWGPAGYPGTMECYPGDDLVDAASVTLKSDSEMLLDVYPKNYPVKYDLMRRLHRLRFINKPIFVIGSKQSANDSIDKQLVSSISEHISQEKNIVYSTENFHRSPMKFSGDSTREIEIGLYDPQSLLNSEKPLTVEHLFVDFGSLNDGSFLSNFNNVVGRGHNIIVTFEPFRNPNGELDLQVLQNVTKGKYNQEITKLYSIIKSTSNRIYLRYAHEMEIPITRYPWQSQDPVNYIKSYRYFMTFQNPFPENILRIWGPAGDRGSLEWWPGNDVVDFISIAIYGLPDKNITDPKKQESFSTIFNRKYSRMRFVDKPFFITEFGVKGPEEYKTAWLEDAAKTIRENHQIVGINYFNMSDTPKAWGDIEPPDWSISKKSFYHFLEMLNEE